MNHYWIATMPNGVRVMFFARSKWRVQARAFRLRGERPVDVEKVPTSKQIGIGALLSDNCEIESEVSR